MSENGHREANTIFANTNTLKAIIILKKNYNVHFRPSNSISSVLGFSNKFYKSKFEESDNTVNILYNNSMIVKIDIILGSCVNGSIQPTI